MQTSTNINIQQKFDIQQECNIRPFNYLKVGYSTRILLNTPSIPVCATVL